MTRIALIGAGVVGSSWTLVFARAGFEVAIYDADPASAARVPDVVRTALVGLETQGLVPPGSAETIAARVRPAKSIEDALTGVDYVQESVPERLPIKVELYRTLDSLAEPQVVLASSTSGLPASAFTEKMATRGRCLVVHPINPPHLIPLVEIVPSPWTTPGTVERARAQMLRIGQSPIQLSREISGFVVNRLQSALLAEAFRLVEDGIVDADEVDRAISDGLGLRWCFMGPFQTIDLNAKTGIAEYCRNLGPMYHGLAKEQADPRPWPDALVTTIERTLRKQTSAGDIPARQRWRDNFLAKLVDFKRRMANPATG
ncbi:3-hydroxyacyl-CoA dehydrogenase [Bradyrhizobium sp. UFLA03-84]|uniref:3-hydroxyacyl-CoA dehydrogenase n=1 Tax=Bradyrhizobium sp. UFLA03-84 TaxID=418599 RepID=UPI000BADF3CA|nr:3-hydroxyacyl-CoA dehydrogenase [Bradyrhizobium sp. UFLA03-84]PAY05270.1 3-hydroxyacyl-CoA dehydrogenase [Bradyrhizobium sp. UFLA03-84]